MSIPQQHMEKINQSFSYFDFLGIALFVTEAETDRILYASKAMNALYGVKENPAGKACYSVYGEGCAERCGFCPMPRLVQDPGQSVEWERYNERTKKWFRHVGMLTDWSGDTRVHIEYVVDLTCVEEMKLLAARQQVQQEIVEEDRWKVAEKQTQLMLDTLPLAAYLISRQHKLVDCNMAAVHMFQAKDREHLTHSFLEDFSPEYQLDGRPSLEKATELIDKAFNEGFVTFEWIHQMPNGEHIPVEITLVHADWKESGDLICAYARDLRQVKQAERELLQKSMLLEMVNKIAERLLTVTSSATEEELHISLRYLAKGVNVDSVRMWKNVEKDGELCYELALLWPDAAPTEQKAELKRYDALPFWKDSIFGDRIINGPVHALPKAEREALGKLGIRSVLAIPLMVGDEIWGAVSFDDCRHVKFFSAPEEQALRSASTLLASAIQRNHITQELVGANEQLVRNRNLLSAVNHVAELILSSERKDFPLVVQKCLKLIGESVGADRASLWENHVDEEGVSHITRLPGWLVGKPFESATRVITLRLYDYVPEWENTDAPQDMELAFGEMNEHLQELTILQGGEALLLMPLFLQEKFWGMVGIGHRDEGRHFSREERDIIRSGSLMIAESVMRNKLTESLREVGEIAAKDALTGLMNRASFIPQGEAAFEHAKRKAKLSCVMFLDIDHFKKVNDRYGHPFGDTVLVRFAEILRNSVRPQDLCARYGGEEFVIMLENTTAETAYKVTERIMDSLRETRFEEEPEFTFTVSIGLVSGVPKETETLHSYIGKADSALYRAKNTGRNRVVDFADI